jgi:hypothetical protein
MICEILRPTAYWGAVMPAFCNMIPRSLRSSRLRVTQTCLPSRGYVRDRFLTNPGPGCCLISGHTLKVRLDDCSLQCLRYFRSHLLSLQLRRCIVIGCGHFGQKYCQFGRQIGQTHPLVVAYCKTRRALGKLVGELPSLLRGCETEL